MQGQDATRRIRRQADRLRTLDAHDARTPAFRRWFSETSAALAEIFGAGKGPAREFQLTIFEPLNPSKYDPDSDWRHAYERGVPIALTFFDSVVRDLTEHPLQTAGHEDSPGSAGGKESGGVPTPSPSGASRASGTASVGEVVVFAGADAAVGGKLARWLEGLGATAVVVTEPSPGESPVTRMESASAFGVVVLAPAERKGTAKSAGRGSPRPAPSRMFELGFLLGRLGPKKVCGLLPAGVEMPFAIPGTALVPMDGAGAWKWGLASAMAAAGLPVDPANAAGR